MTQSDFIRFTLQLADTVGVDILGILGQIGNMLSLRTNHKSTLVGAINEVYGKLDGYLQPSDLNGFVYDVTYNGTNHVITIFRQNAPNIVIDLPVESLIKNIDVVGDDLVLTFEDDTQKVVPLNTLLVGVIKKANGLVPNSLGEVVINIQDIPGLSSILDALDIKIGTLPSLTTAHKTDLVGAINEVNQKQIKVNIGGRNLAIHSTSLEALPLYGVTGDYEVINDASLPSKKYFRLTNIVRTAGDYVFYIPFGNRQDLYSYNLTNVPLTISFFIRTNNSQLLTGNGANANITSVFQKVEFQTMWGGAGNAHFYLSGAGLSFMEIHSLKIEIGTKSTDWTPAPEDQVSDWNQTDSTQFDFIKGKPDLSLKANISDVYNKTSIDNFLANKANINGSNTTGGSWAIDYILSPVLQNVIGNGQVINIPGDDSIRYGSVVVGAHIFHSSNIYGLLVYIQGQGLGNIWHQFNFDPNTKADVTYVDSKIAAIPVHNGQLTVNTTADLVGGFVYLPSGNISTTLGLATHILNAIADGVTAYSWGNHANQGYLKIVDLAPYALISQLPTVNNGSFVVQGVGDLTGAGTTSANASANSVASLDLSNNTKNRIQRGVDAYNIINSGSFGGKVRIYDFSDSINNDRFENQNINNYSLLDCLEITCYNPISQSWEEIVQGNQVNQFALGLIGLIDIHTGGIVTKGIVETKCDLSGYLNAEAVYACLKFSYGGSGSALFGDLQFLTNHQIIQNRWNSGPEFIGVIIIGIITEPYKIYVNQREF